MKKNVSLLIFCFYFSLFGFCQNREESTRSVTVEKDRVLALNTNFVLPIMRFDLLKTSYQEKAFGSLSLFNSIGAGVSLNFGEQMEISESESSNEDLDEKFVNMIGLQLGFIFSADLNEAESSLHFAPTIALQVLDFQIGLGYELGKVNDEASRTFITLGYGIPLQKLTRTGTWELKSYGFKPGKSSKLL